MESPGKIAERRLHPPLTDASYLLLRARRIIFENWVKQLPGGRLRVLDVGGRYQPYRPLLEGRVGQYVAVDLVRTELVGVVADAEALPFARESFDVVIATQVLEYLRDPVGAAQLIHGLLRPGGVFLASVAAFAPRFTGEERWRFLPAGLRTMFAPYAKVDIVPELDSLCSMVRTVNLAMFTFVRYNFARRVHSVTSCPLLNLLGLGLGKMHLTANDQFAANFSVRAIKAE